MLYRRSPNHECKMDKLIKVFLPILLLVAFGYWAYLAYSQMKIAERAVGECDRLLAVGDFLNAYNFCFIAIGAKHTIDERRQYTLLAISVYLAASEKRIPTDYVLVSDMQYLIRRDSENHHAQYIVGLYYWAQASAQKAREHLEVAIENPIYRRAYRRFVEEDKYVDEGFELFMSLVGVPIPGLGQLKAARTTYKLTSKANKAKSTGRLARDYNLSRRKLNNAQSQEDENLLASLERAQKLSDIARAFEKCKVLTEGRRSCRRTIVPPTQVTVPPPRNGQFRLNMDTRYFRILRNHKYHSMKQEEEYWTKGLTATEKVSEIPCYGGIDLFLQNNQTVILTDVGIQFRKSLMRNDCSTFPRNYEGHYLHIVEFYKKTCKIPPEWAFGRSKQLPCIEFKPRWTDDPKHHPVMRFRNERARQQFLDAYQRAYDKWHRKNQELMEIVVEKYKQARRRNRRW